MPFTGSHPAVVLPLLRFGLPASALVIGSMVPDLPYYVPGQITAPETHSPSAVLGVDVLLGIAVFLVWHLVLVAPLVWAAPAGLQARIPDHLRGGLAPDLLTLAGWLRVYLALAVGAATHLVWDAFTHTGRWGAAAFPWLDGVVLGLPLVRWLHLASSAVGLALVGWYAVAWYRRAPAQGTADPIRPEWRWGIVAVLLAWAGWAALRTAAGLIGAPGRVSRQVLLIDTLVAFIAALGLGFVVAALTWHAARALQRSRVRMR